MKIKDLNDVLTACVRDIYSAETQALRAMPKVAKAAESDELREAIQTHIEQTRGQVERLDQVCELLEIKGKGKTCEAMKGLIVEAQELLEADGDPTAIQAALVGAVQKMEHYEISSYGTARTIATALGEQEVADLLQETLDEEKEADRLLSELAENGLNQEAAEGDDEGEEDEEEEEAPKAPARKPARRR